MGMRNPLSAAGGRPIRTQVAAGGRPFRALLAAAMATLVVAGCDGEEGPTGPPEGKLEVVGVEPTPLTVRAPDMGPVVVTLSEPLEPMADVEDALHVFGRNTGVVPGATRLREDGRALTFEPSRPLMAGELVTATLAAGLEDAEGRVLRSPYAWQFRVGTSAGTLELSLERTVDVRRPGEARIATYGTYAGDFNGDGFADLAAPNEVTADVRLFLNDGAGGYHDFVILPVPGGGLPSPNEGLDLNGDGLLDYVVANGNVSSVAAFQGDGAGGLDWVGSRETGGGAHALCLLDVDGDARTDVVTANQYASGEGNISILLVRPDGSLGEAETLELGAGAKWGCAAVDVNGDGWLDLLVSNADAREIEVLLGSPGGLTPVGAVPVEHRPGRIVAADLDGDGRADLASADYFGATVSVLLGDGTGGFTPAGRYDVAAQPIALDVGDLDGDGDLELVTSSRESGVWNVLENDGQAGFTVSALAGGTSASCAALHDRDRDGRLDLTGTDEQEDRLYLFRNAGG